MADEYQSSPDEHQDQGPTPDELQAAEMAKTAQTLQLVQAMNQTVAPLPMTLPTQAAPVGAPPPPPMTGTQPPPVAPVEPPRNRMFMGPNIGGPTNPQEFFGALSPNRLIMPPAMRNPAPLSSDAQAAMQSRLAAGTGGESDPAALSRLQASDAPGARTLAVRSESPNSDASLANQRNAMLYNAMKKFDAGDRSPEVMAAAMGWAAPRTMTEYQQNETRLRQQELEQKSKSEADRMSKVKAPGIPAGLSNMHRAMIQDWVKEVDPVQKTAKKAALDAFVKENPELIGGTAAASPLAAKRKVGSFKVGEVLDGYRFKGGNERDRKNWEKV